MEPPHAIDPVVEDSAILTQAPPVDEPSGPVVRPSPSFIYAIR